ncbi:MAG: adenylosuccinate lyase [Sandaracinaceae bacterium]
MIPRYTPDDFAALFTSETKYQTWLEVELAACEAMETAGLVPPGTAETVRPFGAQLSAERIDAIERVTRHDVIAFLTHVEELAGPPARWLHLGMTSSDVLDSALAVLLTRATDMLLARCDALIESFARRATEHQKTPMIGRSHGIHAEPTTFGVALAGHLAELSRGRARLRAARAEVAVGKIAGAVGTYAHLSPAIEEDSLRRLGLSAETVSTQVVARDRHAALVSACATIAAAIERFAINVRHWQRTEVLEAEEPFAKGQKGSSAMPHKRNPILSENLSGLARVVRAGVVPALENIGLWHERDISHSSVERMLLPDVTTTLAFMLDRTKKLIDGLVVYPENLRANLEQTGGLWASGGVLLALVHAGKPRQEAYVWVQRNAMRAFHGEGAFLDLLLADEDIRSLIDEATVRKQLDLDHALTHAETIVGRALRDAGVEPGS